MSLPEQIRKQVEVAEDIIKRFEGEADATPPEDKQDDGSAKVAATESEQQPGAPAVQPAEDENSESYAQRWRSLQGIQNMLVQRAQNAEARAQAAELRIGQLEQLIATMQFTPPAQDARESNAKLITDKDRSEYGEDMVDFAQRAARQEVSHEVGQLQQTIHALQAELGQLRSMVPTVNRVVTEQRATRASQFIEGVATYIPDWREINGNPQFHEWLLSADPMTGIQRQTYLKDAEDSFDVGRVVNIFNTWKSLTGNSVQQSRTAARATQSELERQVAPGKTLSSGAPPSSPDVKQWTTGQVSKFYDDVRKGVYKGRETERAAMERDLFLAQREGRIARAA